MLGANLDMVGTPDQLTVRALLDCVKRTKPKAFQTVAPRPQKTTDIQTPWMPEIESSRPRCRNVVFHSKRRTQNFCLRANLLTHCTIRIDSAFEESYGCRALASWALAKKAAT